MAALQPRQVHFGPCIVKSNGVQLFQLKDGVAIVVKKSKIEQKDDAGGTTVRDRYGTGISACSLEGEVVNMSKEALAEALNKAHNSTGTSAKSGVTVNESDGLGQSEYENAITLEVFKVRNNIVQTAPCFVLFKGYPISEPSINIGAEKQGMIKTTYNGYPADSGGTTATGIVFVAGDMCRFVEVLGYGQV